MSIPDFKYGALLRGGGVHNRWSQILKPRSEFLHPVDHAFAENVWRMDSLVSMPAELAARVRREQIWRDCAILKITGKLEPDVPQALDDATRWKVEAETARLRSNANTLKSHERSKIGIPYINRLLHSDDGTIQSIESLLSLAIIDTWAAFEVLVPDLWSVAVNCGPAEFRKRINISNEQSKPDPTIAKNWGNKLQYDPRTHYAEALLESGRVSFKRLDRIIRWYSITFKNDIHKLFDDVQGGYIYALAAYRNLLVHRGREIDKDFIMQIAPVDELRDNFTEGEKLILDGEIVSKLRNTGIELGQELLLFVDDLITPTTSASPNAC